MKKIFVYLLLIFCYSVFPVTHVHAEDCSISTSPDTLSVGQTVSITVTMSGPTTYGYVHGYISVDSAYLQTNSITSSGYSTFSVVSNQANFGTWNDGSPEYQFTTPPHSWTVSYTGVQAG